MNLYFVRWTTAGGFGLSATVAADTDAAALAELELSDFEKLDSLEEVGTAKGGRFTYPQVLCRESL